VAIPVPDALPDECEVVKWHTRQKHQFIEQYLAVWTGRVAKRGRAAPKLSVVDLFGSFGWCRTDSGVDPGSPVEPWPGTALLVARALSQYPRPGRLVINSFSPDGSDESARQSGCVQRAVAAEIGNSGRFPLSFISEDVASAARTASSTVDLDYPSLWILDPYFPETLPWEVVNYIAQLRHEYRTPKGVQSRRPEMMITLMTEGLQRNVDLNPHTVNLALGMTEDVWRPRMEELRGEGANIRQALTYMYSERLQQIYGKWPTVLEVDASGGNIVYALVLCSSHDAGTFVPKILLKPEFQAWRIEAWKPTARLITRNRSIRRSGGPGAAIQHSLDESFKPG
jgi:three-Cys-motif partner protein